MLAPGKEMKNVMQRSYNQHQTLVKNSLQNNNLLKEKYYHLSLVFPYLIF